MAKRARTADDENPPTAKRAKRRARGPAVKARKAKARRAIARANPDGGWGPSAAWVDDLKSVGVGLSAYGGTRLVQRLATRVTQSKKPGWVKHVHALSGAVVFGATLLAVRKVKQIAAYEGAIVLGTGLAAVQGVVSSYAPDRFLWLVNDSKRIPVPQTKQQLGENDMGDYLEEQLRDMEDQSALPRTRRAPVQQALKTAAAASGDIGLEEALVDELGDEGVDDLYAGVFQSPSLLST